VSASPSSQTADPGQTQTEPGSATVDPSPYPSATPGQKADQTTDEQPPPPPPFTLPSGIDFGVDPAFAPIANPAPTAEPAPLIPEPPDANTQSAPESAPGPAGAPIAEPVEPDTPSSAPEHRVEIADPGLATPLAPPPVGTPVHIEADDQQKVGDVYTLNEGVHIDYKQYKVQADHATYNSATSEVVANGHVTVDGGPEDEHIVSDHGVMNLDAHTAHYWDAVGTLGVRALTHDRYTFTAPNPFFIAGDEIYELGQGSYKIIDGTMTSCRLPHPDWKLLAKNIFIDNGEAKARNSLFELKSLPVAFLPYVSHPTQKDQRQSGFLIPVFGNSTSRGFIAGEEAYLVLGRSADVTLGSLYYSLRGFAPYGQLRYQGRGEDFGLIRFHSLLDRLPGSENQGGVDVLGDVRHYFTPNTRAIADIEYLSSYVYRQAFEANFTAAINSEVKSQAWLIHERNGYSASGGIERYQNFLSDNQGDEIKILHTPELHVDAIDHPIGNTRLLWGGEATADAMSRSEPGFQTSSGVPRVDFFPHITLPLSAGAWTLRSEAGIRETYYGKSQDPGAPGIVPTESSATLNRTAFSGELDLRPPVAERDFSAPWLRHWFGGDIRHTIEPEFSYRYVTGINNFQNVLRVDQTDVFNNTNELEYGLTQHLFLRHLHKRPCKGEEKLGPDKSCGGGTVDWLSWRVAQKHYFDPYFGNALAATGYRNVLESTLDFTGIAFLTGPRSASPVISRLRLRTSTSTDFEWDLDYDTKAGRLQDSSVSMDYRTGPAFFSFGDYQIHTLNGAPGSAQAQAAGLSNFNQIRLAAIYGSPVKHGLSTGMNLGYDLALHQVQYLGAQAGYNRDCCGLTMEVRRYSLGLVRDDTQYLFSFTLAGVGTAGSLNRMLRVF
jgi:LPS-assembly protein